MPPLADLVPRRCALIPSRAHRYFQLRYDGKTRCLGGTAAHLALVARGAVEFALVAPGWSSWDTAAGLALISVLGGEARSLVTGESIHPFRHEGEAFVAGSPAWVAKLLRPGALTPLPEPT
jgi:fructose-1,6-bisphosphatase/inositol monophosphatase family enzyme